MTEEIKVMSLTAAQRESLSAWRRDSDKAMEKCAPPLLIYFDGQWWRYEGKSYEPYDPEEPAKEQP